jgi:peptide-methionine (S)-S-oxide reductase
MLNRTKFSLGFGAILGSLVISLAINLYSNPTTQAEDVTENPNLAKATLAGGCFWCTEAVFERMNGVADVTSGYLGGQSAQPSYKEVCMGTTGHAEAVQITFDPTKVTFDELLQVFFKTHDPTTLNRQGADEGTQYRSAIFPHDDAQRQVAQAYIKQLNESGDFKRPIVTSIEAMSEFYVAEEYHQDYFRRNPDAPYCRAVVAQKVRKFNHEFGDKIAK